MEWVEVLDVSRAFIHDRHVVGARRSRMERVTFVERVGGSFERLVPPSLRSIQNPKVFKTMNLMGAAA